MCYYRDYQFVIGYIYLFVFKWFQVSFCHLNGRVSQCLADNTDIYSCMKC